MSFNDNMITELENKIKELEQTNKELSVENFNLENTIHELNSNMEHSISKELATLLFKIQKVKQKLHNMHLKKSGKNTYNHYDYYELEDINKPICDALIEEGLASKFKFNDVQGRLVIVDVETGAYTSWCTPLDISIRYKKSLENTSKKGSVGDVMQDNQALQTYARRALYLQALEISEPNVIENNGSNNTNKNSKKGATGIDDDEIKMPHIIDKDVNNTFNQIRKDFGNKVQFNKTTVRNKLGSMLKDNRVDKELYDKCMVVVNNEQGENM